MRRTDREVHDLNEIEGILTRCDTCRIALANNNIPYIVALSFGYTLIEGELTFYFHSANQGQKIAMIANNNLVAFQMDCDHEFIKNEAIEHFTMNYGSIVGQGIIEEISDEKEKVIALNHIMHHYINRSDYEFKRCLEMTLVLRLKVSEYSAKKNHKNQ